MLSLGRNEYSNPGRGHAPCTRVLRHPRLILRFTDFPEGTHLQVELFEGAAHEWDGFGRTQLGWTAFHRYAWRPFIERVFGHQCRFLAARDAERRLVGILPLVRVRSPLFGHFLVSMPFVSYGGPLGSDAAIVALAEYAERLAQSDRADLLELRSARALPIAMPVSHRKITVVLPLVPNDPEAVFKGFKAKLRSQVRRPAKEGVEVRMGADQAPHFHAVFARHMRDLGTPTLPLAWFTGLAEAFGEDVWFAVAWHNGAPIAAGAGFRWEGEFEITWASALREFNSLSPNMAVYWALIERASREGLTRFNFGRCTEGSPTHRFKTQWGALDEPLYWYGGGARGLDAMPSQTSGKFALATRIWQKLPLGITNALGPRLVRYIP